MTDAPHDSSRALPLAGRWQMPLLLVSLVVLGLATWHWLASAPKPSWDERLGELAYRLERHEGTDFTPLEAQARLLLEDVPSDRLAECTGRAYALLGDIRWRSMKVNTDFSREQFQALHKHYHQAFEACHLPASADQAERYARALEELDSRVKAMHWYGRATEKDPARRARLDWHVIELALQDRGLTGEDLLDKLRAFMRAQGLPAEMYAKALERSVDLLLDMQRPDRADELLTAERLAVGENLEPVDCQQHLEFQQARVWAWRGWTDQADNHLIQLIPTLSPTSALYAQACLLRGQLIRQDNPIEAEKLLRGVIVASPRTPMAVAAAAVLAQAYGDLRRYDKALEQYDAALKGLLDQPANPYLDLRDLRQALIADHQALMHTDRPAEALGFVKAECGLLALPGQPFLAGEQAETMDRLGATHLALAGKAGESLAQASARLAPPTEQAVLRGQQEDQLVAAGQAYARRAKLVEKLDVRQYGQSLWLSADAFKRAGHASEAIEALRGFIASQPTDERVPEARFLLGQSLQALRRYEEAIAVYRDNLQSAQPPGRHTKAIEGRIPMAMCYVAKGPDSYDQAEAILSGIIHDESMVFTPDSEQYHSALFVLGWLHHRQGQWSKAQQTLGEAIQRSPGRLGTPGDPDYAAQRERFCRATWGMFLTADSYHKSARQLAAQAQQAKARLRRQFEEARDQQLGQAQTLYSQVIQRVEQLAEPRGSLDEAYRRNSYFARGDCLFELGQYAEALERYEEAVFHYQTHPAALGGLMGEHNCHVALGKHNEARAVLERARQLRRQIPEGAFGGPAPTQTPESWDRWLDSLGQLDPVVARVQEAP